MKIIKFVFTMATTACYHHGNLDSTLSGCHGDNTHNKTDVPLEIGTFGLCHHLLQTQLEIDTLIVEPVRV